MDLVDEDMFSADLTLGELDPLVGIRYLTDVADSEMWITMLCMILHHSVIYSHFCHQ